MPPYLLDTSVVLALIRWQELGKRIDATYGLRQSRERPVICVVSHGELWAIARRLGFGESKQHELVRLLDELVTVELDRAVIDAYAEVQQLLHTQAGGARTLSNNDAWIAAATRAAGATLLTTDADFDSLIPGFIRGHRISGDAPR